MAFFLLVAVLSGCRPSTHPVTLSYFRLGWSQPDEMATAEPLSQRFIRETGIQLRNLPVPETTLDQLALSRKLLEGGTGLDVLNVDLIWSGVLQDDLLDLRPYVAQELSLVEPALLPSYVVNGRLVAIPYTVQVGAIEYRADLLREYGYNHPPKTWDELETMALKIQSGERAKGRKNFWGYVWQGADAEALTCNALEWQASEGGGRIIEDDGTISVNNPAAIKSWERAKHWIGWISPPSVAAYRERDSMDVFGSDGALFNRVWKGGTVDVGGQSRDVYWRESLAQAKTGYTSIPAGAAGWAGTLGGSGLAVSKHSLHPKEAAQLVSFLVRAAVEEAKQQQRSSPVLPDSPNSGQHKSGIVIRPSSLTGDKYDQVAKAYMDAVHSVLTGEQKAPEAAAELEKQLIKITGFRTGPPKPLE